MFINNILEIGYSTLASIISVLYSISAVNPLSSAELCNPRSKQREKGDARESSSLPRESQSLPMHLSQSLPEVSQLI